MKRAGARSPRGIARAFIPLALLMALLSLTWPFTAQAEITVVDYSTAGGDDVSSLTLDKPSGTSEGQLMLAQVTVVEQCTRFLWWCLYDVNEITSPTGWNELRENEGAWNFDDSFLFRKGQRVKQAIYYRFASASEPSTYEWRFDVRGPAAAAITVFDDVDPDTPFDAHSGQGGLGITATAPSIQTTTASTMLVALFGAERGNPNIGLPTGMRELYRLGTGGGPDGIRIAASTEPMPQAGDTGPRVATLAQSQNQASSNVGQLVALRERGTGFDHIRIEHDGQGLTCQPETVTVKACANADCSILYTDPVTTTLSPAGDTVSFSGGQATAQLSWATPGPTTLGAIDTTPPPANPTRCFKGTTESCTMVFSACAGDFTCLETGTLTSAGSDLRNGRLYTKLAEQHFSFDVAALKSDGTLESDFVAEGGDPRTVTVELVAVSSSEVLATQELTFVREDGGRNPIAQITVNKASREVKCRVTDRAETPPKVSYSTDSFAIRPQAFSSVTTSNATADPANGLDATATPIFKAGADTFDLTATAIAGYDGTPKIDNADGLEAHAGAVQVGTISGDFEPASSGTGEATGSSFTYSEVGYFYFKPYAVYDDEFTSVDEPQGDCLNDFSNTFVNGKVGCKFGNESETVRFGRFIPDHFDTVVTHACTGFSYSGQPFGLKVIAKQKNATIDPEHGVTKNYTGDFAKDITLSDANGTAGQFKRDQASCPPDNICVQAGDFSEGVANLGVMEGNVTDPATAKIAFVFEELKPPSIIQVRAHDDDTEGVEGRAEGQTEIRYGRMYAERVHEPLETNPLSLSLMAQYFDGAAFVTNNNDSCTAIAIDYLRLDNNLEQGQTDGTIKVGTGNTALTLDNAQGLFNLGKLTLNFSAPGRGNSGFVDITPLLDASHANLPWLQYDWNGDGSPENPRGRASWGMYRGNPYVIYMREVWN